MQEEVNGEMRRVSSWAVNWLASGSSCGFYLPPVCPLQPVALFRTGVLSHAGSYANCILGKWEKCYLNTLKNDTAQWLFTEAII